VKVCAIIPAFNEEKHIAEVARRVASEGVLPVVVDDCSSDGTVEIARRAGAEVVVHEVNKGKGKALATGFAWAHDHGYDAGVTLDGDGQHDPAEIRTFLKCAEATGADVIVGTRMASTTDMPPVRKFTNWFMSLVLSFMARHRLTDSQSGYRLVRVDAWRRLGLTSSRFDTESEMLVRACRMGMIVREVPIRTIYGDEVSAIHPIRDSLRWVTLLWRLSKRSR
jgi:glycosyltransferase involved in cell wall biosynthesis